MKATPHLAAVLLGLLLSAALLACSAPRRIDRPVAPAPKPPLRVVDPTEPGSDYKDPIAWAERHRLERQRQLRLERALARRRLARAESLTNLDDEALATLRAAEVSMARGDYAEALARVERLESLLAHADREYRVSPGDSLWRIAARPDVYGNGLLWPLIYQANRQTLADPGRLRVGQRLRIRRNPTVAEVAAAIDEAGRYARRQRGSGPARDRH